MPDLPGGSSAAPTLYQSMWVTTGVRRSGITTTSRPLASVKWRRSAARRRRLRAGAASSAASAAAAMACVSLIGTKRISRGFMICDDRIASRGATLGPTRERARLRTWDGRRRSASRPYLRAPHLTGVSIGLMASAFALADAVGLGRRRRAVAGRRLGQAGARRLAGEGGVFFLRADQAAER